jgi:hypothetical protein
METHHAGYTLSDDPARLDLDAIHAYLDRSYWAANRPAKSSRSPSPIHSASAPTRPPESKSASPA